MRGLYSMDPDKFAQAAAAQEERERREEWPLLHGDGAMTLQKALNPDHYLPADQADAALELLRINYADLLLRHDALMKKYDAMLRASLRILEVLAVKEKAYETVQ